MNRAIQLRWPETDVGVRALFKMDPPLEDSNGVSHEYVVASAIDEPDGTPCTFIFAADESGVIASWSELDGTKGVKDIWGALRNLGYDPVPLVEVIDSVSPQYTN